MAKKAFKGIAIICFLGILQVENFLIDQIQICFLYTLELLIHALP